MTQREFSSISVGAPIKTVISKSGKPYRIEKLDDGTRRYIYIERFRLPSGAHQDRHYIFLVCEGRIKDKYFFQEGEKQIDFLLKNRP